MKHQKLFWMLFLASLGTTGCVKETSSEPIELIDECPDNPNKNHPGVRGCKSDDIVDALTGLYTCLSTTIDL